MCTTRHVKSSDAEHRGCDLHSGRRTKADYQKPLFQKVSYYRHQMSFPRRTALSAFTDILVFYLSAELFP